MIGLVNRQSAILINDREIPEVEMQKMKDKRGHAQPSGKLAVVQYITAR